MQGRIIFLLEEPSMETLLKELLPRLFLGFKYKEHFLCIPHEGKSDLDKSIPRKLKGWSHPQDHFVIVRDNDNANCIEVKKRFIQLCKTSGRPDTLIRLVCQELESWYLGDLAALADAFNNPKLNSAGLRKKYKYPDTFQKPSADLKNLIPNFQKSVAAKKMAQRLTKENNVSPSFNVFISGIDKLIKSKT